MVNMAPSAVLERIRKMELQGIIDGYEVRLNPERFNCKQIAFIHVFLSEKTNTTAIENQLAEVEQIQEIHFIAGEDGYFIKVRVADTEALDTLIRVKLLTIKGVKSTRTLTVLSTRKETAQIPIQP